MRERSKRSRTVRAAFRNLPVVSALVRIGAPAGTGRSRTACRIGTTTATAGDAASAPPAGGRQEQDVPTAMHRHDPDASRRRQAAVRDTRGTWRARGPSGEGTSVLAAVLWLLGAGAPAFAAGEVAPAVDASAEAGGPYGGRHPGRTGEGERTRLGSFLLQPRLQVAELFDDNLFATPDREVTDYVTIVSPALSVESDWLRHALRFATGADVSLYARDGAQQTEDFWVDGEGRYDVSQQGNLFGGARYARWHEDRTSPDSFFGAEPTTLYQVKAYGGATRSFGPVSLRIGGTLNALDFNDVPTPGGEFNMDDRDRVAYTGGLWLGYDLDAHTQVFGEASFDGRRYDQGVDDAGFRRDSNGYRARAGVRLERPGSLQAELYLGHLAQYYEDPALDDIGTAGFGANVGWLVDDDTRIDFYVDRSIDETTLAGSSAAVFTLFAVRAEHTLAPGLIGVVHANDNLSDFEGIERVDNLLDYGVGARLDLTPRIFVAADYWLLNRRSEDQLANHWRNQVMLSVGLRLGEVSGDVWQGDDTAWSDAHGALGGFYAGARVSHGTATAALRGTRGQGNSFGPVSFGLGADDVGVGGMAGYGHFFGPWYLGFEFAADSAAARLEHDRLPRGREIDVERSETLSLAARFGYGLHGALLYGLAGVVHSELDSLDASTGATSVNSEEMTGAFYGLGLQVPVVRSWFVQLEQRHADYGDFRIGRDELRDNADQRFHLGIGTTFGGRPVERPHHAPALQGPYVGVMVGAGTAVAELSGPRELGTTFDGGFADTGLTAGLFGGYAWRLDPFQLALEVEAQGSGADWTQTRGAGVGGGRRDITAGRKGVYGVAARLGYVLPSGVSLYARGGYVSADYFTTYFRDQSFVFQDDRLDGRRIGFGSEVPLAARGFLRLEYVYTDYAAYGINYRTGADRIANVETETRLALGFRF